MYLQERLLEIAEENRVKLKRQAEVAQALRESEEKRLADQLNPPRVGHVYFIKSGDLVKIGFTVDLQQRVKAIRNGNPHELTLLGSMPGTDDTEYFLHQMFARYRQHGEWFRIEGDLDGFLVNLPGAPKTRARGKKGAREGHRLLARPHKDLDF